MKLGIMQPYFAPYPGYFDLISQCDEWIVFDTAQYIRHGWVNRNRILHPTTGWQYVIVPLQKQARETAIMDTRIAADNSWRARILGQLQHYRGKAPHFGEVVELVTQVLADNTPSLSRLNVLLMQRCCERLGIRFNFRIFSEMKLALPEISDPGQWALEISAAVGATEYINPPGGKDLFKPADFAARGITLTIQQPSSLRYETPGYDFVPDLSILDALMWNSPDAISRQLRQHKS